MRCRSPKPTVEEIESDFVAVGATVEAWSHPDPDVNAEGFVFRRAEGASLLIFWHDCSGAGCPCGRGVGEGRASSGFGMMLHLPYMRVEGWSRLPGRVRTWDRAVRWAYGWVCDAEV